MPSSHPFRQWLDRKGWAVLLGLTLCGVVAVLNVYPRPFSFVLLAVPAAITLIFLPIVLHEKPRNWKQLVYAGAGVLVGVVALTELALAAASFGIFPAQYPDILVKMAGPRAANAVLGSYRIRDNKVRAEADKQLRSLGPRARPALVAGGRRKDARTRRAALRVLAKDHHPSVTEVMLAALEDPDQNTQSIPYEYFRNHYDPRIAPTLLDHAMAAPTGDRISRFKTEAVITEQSRINAVAALTQRSRINAVQYLVASVTPDILPYFSEQMRSPDAARRKGVVRAVGQADAAETVTILETALKDRDASIRALAAAGLGGVAENALQERVTLVGALRSGGTVRAERPNARRPPDISRILSLLTRTLRDPDANVRLAATDAWREVTEKKFYGGGSSVHLTDHEAGMFVLRTASVVPALVAYLKDPNLELRKTALETIQYCAGPASVPVLASVLPTVDVETRKGLVEALGHTGSPAAIPLVRKYGVSLHEVKYNWACPPCQALYNLEAYDEIQHSVGEDR